MGSGTIVCSIVGVDTVCKIGNGVEEVEEAGDGVREEALETDCGDGVEVIGGVMDIDGMREVGM
jgi:hypothetical protein